MEIIKSKENILSEINNLYEIYQNNEANKQDKINQLNNEITRHIDINQKLIKEIEEKDKLLITNEKKCYDYEIMINKIQEQANKEMDDKTKHDIIRAKDKEVYLKDQEITSLKKQIETLKNKKESTKKKTLVDKITEINHQENISETIIEEKVVEETKVDDEEKVVEETNVIEETDVVEETDVDDIITETKVVEEEKESESESEEEVDVETITHYRKKYYIIKGEPFIYAIEDGELGDKVGQIINGKKTFYDK